MICGNEGGKGAVRTSQHNPSELFSMCKERASPCPIPMLPIRLPMAEGSRTSLTIPLPFIW